jgi:hypothetical protein
MLCRYAAYSEKDKKKMIREVSQMCLSRPQVSCPYREHRRRAPAHRSTVPKGNSTALEAASNGHVSFVCGTGAVNHASPQRFRLMCACAYPAQKLCNFLEWREYKIVYKRYASLFFITCGALPSLSLLGYPYRHGPS